jgi:glycosyltransferase involved in cell wall biosynthesis
LTSKPEIIAFTTSYFPEIGGAEIALRQVAERLSAGFDFLIVTARGRRANLPKETATEGRVLRLGIGLAGDKWLLPAMAPVVSRLVARRMAEGTPCLLWGMDITQGALLAALVQRLRPQAPFVVTIQYGGGERRLVRGRAGLIAPAVSFLLSRATRVTAVSSNLVDLGRRFGAHDDPMLIPNGVDLARFKPREEKRPGSPPTVITVSRLAPKNGVDTLLQALPPLRDAFPDLRCLVVGDGPERRRLEQMARRLDLNPTVRFLGSVPHDAVPSYLGESDVFVRASRSEGLGTAFLEALAMGLPVIATPVGGIPDIIRDGETGLWTPADDAQQLAQNLRRLLTDRDLARRLGRGGMEHVRKHFDADVVARKYLAVFNEVIAR